MTTTNVFQGMESGSRNSSRVLAPPGGGSSISFGGPSDATPEPAKPAPRKVAAAPAPVMNTTPEPKGSAAGLPIAQKPKETAERLAHGLIKSGGNMKNKGTFNPLTCEDYGKVKTCEFELPPEPPAKPVHTSTKVKEPPGGRSSFSFF